MGGAELLCPLPPPLLGIVDSLFAFQAVGVEVHLQKDNGIEGI